MAELLLEVSFFFESPEHSSAKESVSLGAPLDKDQRVVYWKAPPFHSPCSFFWVGLPRFSTQDKDLDACELLRMPSGKDEEGSQWSAQ